LLLGYLSLYAYDLNDLFAIQIREAPHRSNQKVIEFYDVRAANEALRALNQSDITGKKIKLEPSLPVGARSYCPFTLSSHFFVQHIFLSRPSSLVLEVTFHLLADGVF